MNKLWVIAPPEPAVRDALARQLGWPVALAQALVNRGYRDEAAARRFLQPQLRQLADPFCLPDMRLAVERIQTAIRHHERIVIYGDYDVDGVTSSALLVNVLRAAGATVQNFLPNRRAEGYGLSAEGLARCGTEHQPQLLIAVDCGTSSRLEIAGLKVQGIDVIVLDHHEPPAELPECVALVNPKCLARRGLPGGSPSTTATVLESEPPGEPPLAPFASVGLAFKLAHALLKQDRQLASQFDLRDQLDLVALGTIADLVPLTGENRILVKAGLDRLAATKKIGLRALLDVAGVTGAVTPAHVGFRLGPRLNAAGRLDDAMAAVELVLTENFDRAVELAELLDRHNAERQKIEERIVAEALAQAHERADDRVLVLANPEWHPGVIGIVASRVVQQFYRPTVVIGAEGKGSCRSVTGFSMVGALARAAEVLVRYGGHEMAAGLSILSENIPVLRERLNAGAGVVPDPVIRIDAVVQLAELDAEFFANLEQFEPGGMDNPRPVLAVAGVHLCGAARVVGQKHVKFMVTDGSATTGAIWWGHAAAELPDGELDVAFVPELNEFRGAVSVQLNVRDVRKKSALF